MRLQPVLEQIGGSGALGTDNSGGNARSVLSPGFLSHLAAQEQVVASWGQRRLTSDDYPIVR